MGGVIKSSAPSAPAVAPPAPRQIEKLSSEIATEKALLAKRRGRAATVQTSDRGLMTMKPQYAQKKSLLGE